MEELVEKHSGLLEYVARGILQDQSLVEDCISRVWLRAVERQDSYDPERGAVSTWLAALCRSTALDCLREQRRRQSSAPETLSEALADDSPEPSGASARKGSGRRSPSWVRPTGGSSTENTTISSPPPSWRRNWGQPNGPLRDGSTG